MSVSETEGGRRIDLYVRSLVPRGSRRQQAAVLDRLGTLTDSEAVADYEVHVWGTRAPASRDDARTEAATSVLDRVDRFREWAAANDVSMASTFELREVDAEISGERRRSIVFPRFLLAEYRDGALACVTPHETSEGVCTVADRLGRLARGESREYDRIEHASPSGRSPSRIDRDPEPVASE